MSRYVPIDDEMTHTLQPENSVFVIYNLERLRLVGADIREGFTTKQAQAFLDLHGDDLRTLLETTVKEFMKKKVGK